MDDEFHVVGDVYRGRYSNGDERMKLLRNAGYGPNSNHNLIKRI